MSVSRTRIRRVRRLRAQSARRQEHSLARACPQLPGDREAQGDLDLDGRAVTGSFQGPGFQRARQCPGDTHHQARQDDHSGQLRAHAISSSEGTAIFTGTVVAQFTYADPGGTALDYTATVFGADGTSSAGTINSNGEGFQVK